MSISTLIWVGWIGAATFMALAWFLQRRLRNAGIVDVCWTFEVGALALLDAAYGAGWESRRVAVAAIFTLWSARLGFYLLRDRIVGRPEDGRYAELRRTWGARAQWRFFWFFQAQALAALFFSIPALMITANREPGWRAIEVTALGLWVLGFVGESLADLQLERFKSDPGHRGRTCRVGLWRFSRHPNYFFEWTMWVAYALFASARPIGLLSLVCPAVMLYLLFRVTGIPETEAQAVRSRGDDYRDYQRTTSAFVPWFPKTNRS